VEQEQPTEAAVKSAEIIELHPKEADVKCSFCNTPKSKAKRMVSNKQTGKHICDKCIIKSMGIIHPKADPDRIMPEP
jgi:NAD-dependent SIR2 family protein deacetylase